MLSNSLWQSECFNCRVVVGPCVGSVVFTECVDCTITVAAKEIRCTDCSGCELRAYAPLRESILLDSCTKLTFGGWDVAYPGLDAQVGAGTTADLSARRTAT